MMRPLVGIVFCALTIAMSAFGATKTWTGLDAAKKGVINGNWSVDANWDGGVPPAPGDDLVFPHVFAYVGFNDLPAGTTYGSIKVTAITEFWGNRIQASSVAIGPPASTPPVWLYSRMEIDSAPVTVTGSELMLYGGRFTGPVTASDSSVALYDAASVGPLSMSHGILKMTYNTFSPDYDDHVPRGTATNLTLDSTSSFQVVLRPDKDKYSQLSVTQNVVLGNAAFAYVIRDPAFTVFPAGEQYRIIDNLGSDPVSGTFTGLPEGAIVQHPGEAQKFRISYVGGTGNDVVLTALVTGTSQTSLTTTPNPSMEGQAITLTATVTTSNGVPTGTVDFRSSIWWYGLFCEAPLDANGVARCTSKCFAPPNLDGTVCNPRSGSYGVSAEWRGNATTVGSVSDTVQQVVIREVPTIDLRALALLAIALTAIAVVRLSAR